MPSVEGIQAFNISLTDLTNDLVEFLTTLAKYGLGLSSAKLQPAPIMSTTGLVAIEVQAFCDKAAVDTAMDQRSSRPLPRAIHPYSNKLLQFFASSLSLAPVI